MLQQNKCDTDGILYYDIIIVVKEIASYFQLLPEFTTLVYSGFNGNCATACVCVYLPHSHIRDEQNPATMAGEAKHCHYGRLLVMQISPPIRHQTPQMLILSCRALAN
jgi:hypothetical protein